MIIIVTVPKPRARPPELIIITTLFTLHTIWGLHHNRGWCWDIEWQSYVWSHILSSFWSLLRLLTILRTWPQSRHPVKVIDSERALPCVTLLTEVVLSSIVLSHLNHIIFPLFLSSHLCHVLMLFLYLLDDNSFLSSSFTTSLTLFWL